jgi:methylated-DNA-protein-cysteine methyltransferase related protein
MVEAQRPSPHYSDMKKADRSLWQPLTAKAVRAGKQSGADNPALDVIWNVVSQIPRGQVSTYGAVARAAGLPGCARQTGYALKMAPDSMNLPWHRVVGAGGRIVFPASSRHYREQSKRLRAEGVQVKNGRVESSAMTDLESL